MRAFGKQVCHSLIRFLHEVVDNQKSRFATVKVVQIRQSLMKDDSGIFAKQLLVLSITVDYLARRWIYHSRYIVNDSKHESSLTARRRTGNYSGKGMSKRQHVVAVVIFPQIVLFIPPPLLSSPKREGRAVGCARASARTSFFKEYRHQGGNCTHHHRDYYPKRLVFVYHTVSNNRAIFHRVV